jgi:hypothetical protein
VFVALLVAAPFEFASFAVLALSEYCVAPHARSADVGR